MCKHFKSPLYAILLALTVFFISCSNDESFSEVIDPEVTISAESSIIEMLKRISSKDGSQDNIVDGASCLDIQFPYSVTVDGTDLTIASLEDLQKIEDIFDAADDEQHAMAISFPITVTTADYTVVTVNGDEELRSYISQCIEGGGDPDIECIDVSYPISLFTFSPDLQETNSVVVGHDAELHRFLAGLAKTDLISIEFPMTFELFDGIELTVSNNDELAAAMERAIEICDEDDDNDYNDDDFTVRSLDSLLLACPWSVRRLQTSETASPDEFQDYLLIFEEDGRLISDNGFGPAGEGSWSVTLVDYKVFLEIDLEDAPQFNGTRYTYNVGDGRIKGVAGENDVLLLEQACGYSEGDCDSASIEANLEDGCRWIISDEKGEFFQTIFIDFANRNMDVRNADDDVVDQGNWDISDIVITFNELDTALIEYVGDWEIVACSEERYRLRRGEDNIVLVKQCDDTMPDPASEKTL